ncbi:MAG: hypothetical protein NVSMB4_01160 [Acidimicrobiales bacterium]
MLDRLTLPAEGSDVTDEGVDRSHPRRRPETPHGRGHVHHRFGDKVGGGLLEAMYRPWGALDLVEESAQRNEHCVARRTLSTSHRTDATGGRFADPLGFRCV